MRSFRLAYDECLQRRPLLTKMITSSALFGIGDRLAQRVEKLSKSKKDLTMTQDEVEPEEGRLLSKSAAQTLRMMVWGGMIMTPIMHNWYNLMERVFRGTGKLVTAKKVVADMVVVTPQMPIWFYTSKGFMDGKTLKQAFDDSIQKQPITLLANYMLWPAANTITYLVRRNAASVSALVCELCEYWMGIYPLIHGQPPSACNAVPTDDEMG